MTQNAVFTEYPLNIMYEYSKAHIPLEIGYPTQMKSTQKIWNVHAQRARNLHLGPNATYILLTCVGVLRRG